jgi:VanZ family protein
MLTDFIKKYPFSLLIAIAITALSLFPVPEIELAEDVPLMDKWTHMVMYAILTASIWIEYRRHHSKANPWRLILLGVLAPIAMGGVLELMQAYLTTCRSGEWLDFVADAIGTVIGAGIGGTVKFRF